MFNLVANTCNKDFHQQTHKSIIYFAVCLTYHLDFSLHVLSVVALWNMIGHHLSQFTGGKCAIKCLSWVSGPGNRINLISDFPFDYMDSASMTSAGSAIESIQ